MPRYSRTQEIEHAIGPNGRFMLRVTSSDVELRAVHGGVARVRVQFEMRASGDAEADEIFSRVQYEVRTGDGSLVVSEPRHGSGGLGSLARIFGLGGSDAEVTIVAEVPAGAEITYEGVSGDVEISGFTGTQEYRTVSGDLVMRDLAGSLRVRGVSSDITLRADAPLRLELNTVSGDVSAFAPRFDALRMVTVSGDIELEGELSPEVESRIETVSGDVEVGILGGVTLEVRALSSDVSVSLPHRSEGSRDRRRYVIGDGASRVVFSSMSGDLIAGPARRTIAPRSPAPPAPPMPPVPPEPPSLDPDDQLAILRALERGEIDVDEAAARLAGRKADA